MAASIPGAWRNVARSDGAFVALVVLLVLAAHAAGDLVAALDRHLYDTLAGRGTAAGAGRIVIVGIDEGSIARIGRWPWPRERHAELVDRLAAAGAHTIVETADLSVPQQERGEALLLELERQSPDPEWARRLAQARQALDADGRMARSLALAGNVLLAVQPRGGEGNAAVPARWRGDAAADGATGQQGAGGPWPIPLLGQAAAGTGHLHTQADADGMARQLDLVMDWQGQSVPSLALLSAARVLDVAPSAIRVRYGDAVQLGPMRLPVDGAGRAFLRLAPAHAPRDHLEHIAAADLLEDKVPAGRLAGKLVLVGPTAPQLTDAVEVPGLGPVAPVQFLGLSTAALLAGEVLAEPGWGLAATLALVAALALYLVMVLPRLGPRRALATSAAIALALVAAAALLPRLSGLWLGPALPLAVLLTAHLALYARRAALAFAHRARWGEASAETHRLMAVALQQQGRLDAAFEHLRKVPPGEMVLDNLYNLALDFETRRQFGRALAVYEHVAAHEPSWRDLDDRIPRMRALTEVVTLSTGGGGHAGASLLAAAAAGVAKPMLGRYVVERELGKGAMGIVYQGRDPKIARTVAIKTLSLAQDLEAGSVDAARERFFAEAEVVGRLQHPGIVTVYDAGEEYDLAYIAMELLRGSDLSGRCKPGALLPANTALSIAARVADALAHAHAHGVVHRDIKPANIMYEAETDTVKVTDFGVARMAGTERTRTGAVVGTPSYMSPEQVGGGTVDGRCDVYALGVTLFQLLAGSLPFQGETVPELLYRICHGERPDLDERRQGLPPGVSAAVARAMAREPADRYASADDFAAALRSFLTAPVRAAAEPALPGADRRTFPAPAGLGAA